VFVFGKPYMEIVKAAADLDVDLIVLGSHGRSGISHLLLGSVAEKVVRLAPCPVFTVKAPLPAVRRAA
jgi:nucleotide-binding universal stress UspA family protein